MREYFLKPYEHFDDSVKLDLSNYSTKADLKEQQESVSLVLKLTQIKQM